MLLSRLQTPSNLKCEKLRLLFFVWTKHMPPFKRGSVVVFEASRVSKEKLRVSITMDDKLVTFDWQVDDPCDGFYFAMGFQHSGWQISV